MNRKRVAKDRLADMLDKTAMKGRARDVRLCGSANVAYAPSGEMISSSDSRIPTAVVHECGHRFCATCAQKIAAKNTRKIRKRLKAYNAPRRDVRFLTLTQPDRPSENARDALDRIASSLRTMLRCNAWKRKIKGGILKVECERSTPTTRERKAAALEEKANKARTNAYLDDRCADRWHASADSFEKQARMLRERGTGEWWHAHGHLLVVGQFWAQSDLLDQWRACMKRSSRPVKTGGRVTGKEIFYGPDCIEEQRIARGELRDYGGARIEAPRRAIDKELAKYIAKPLTFLDLNDDDGCDFLEAMQGRRMLRPFGCLFGLVLSEEAPEGMASEGFDDKSDGADLDPIVGRTDNGRPVRKSAIVWRLDAAAQEERRSRLEELWQERYGPARGPPPWQTPFHAIPP